MMLAGKTFLVTGASSGIGAAAVRLFAGSGANLVITARRREHLEAVRQTAGDAAERIVTVPGDITEPVVSEAAVAQALHTFGRLDGAFNNAGTMGDLGPVEAMDASNWAHVLNVNLTGCFLSAKYQIPALRKNGGGAIVFTSSFVGHTIGFPGMGAYAAAKAGVIGLTQSLAAELGPDNIRVNSLLPGGTRTPMAGDDVDYHDFVAGLHALKRMAAPEEIARAARFLLSDEASFVTGSAMLCDGGNSINKT